MKLRKRTRYAGTIKLDAGFLLKILDLEDGEIHDIRFQDDYLPHKIIHMVVEHPDLPKVDKDEPLKEIYLTHSVTYGDNNVPIKIERMDPPKKLTEPETRKAFVEGITRHMR